MKSSVHNLTIAGILSSLAVMVEIFGGLLPGVGALFSGFSTLFIALGGNIGPASSGLIFMTTTLLIGIFMPASLPFFLLYRGLLGLILGLTHKNHPRLSIGAGTLFLTAGTLVLAHLTGFKMPLLPLIFYSLFFCCLWLYFLRQIEKRLKPRNIFDI